MLGAQNALVVGPWMLGAQNALDHGRYHAPHTHQTMVSGLGHGCSAALCSGCIRPRTLLDPRHPAPRVSECIRPWYHGRAMDALLGALDHAVIMVGHVCSLLTTPALLPRLRVSFQTPASDARLQFLMCLVSDAPVSDARWLLMRSC